MPLHTGVARFLAACHQRRSDATPIWFMRQAGRCLAQYRELRHRYDILTMAKTPELCAQVQAETLTLRGLVISLDGHNVVRAHQSMIWTAATPLEQAEHLGVAVAKQALPQGAASILSRLKASREREQQDV